MINKYIVSFFVFGISTLFFLSPNCTAYANNPPDQGHSSINASNQAPANGSSTINVTVTLEDNNGNSDSGDSVSFSSPNDSAAVFSPGSTTLNSSGQASFTVTSTNAQTDEITVVDTTSNTTLADLGEITFSANGPTATPTPTCGPAATPQITNAVSNGDNEITLTWTDSDSSSVEYYILSYGTASGKYVYGNPNIGGPGTTSYTVSALNDGTTYYFAIEATNSCSTSSFSNEISAVAGSTTSPTSSPDVSQSEEPSIIPSEQVSPQTSPSQGEPVLSVSPTDSQTSSPGLLFIVIDNWKKILLVLVILILLGIGGYFYVRKYGMPKFRKPW